MATNILNLKTQDEISAEYIGLIKQFNDKTNPDIILSDWWVKGKVLGGVLSGCYQDIYLKSLNIFPQTSTGTAIDKNLASWGLVARLGSTFSISTVGMNAAPSENFIINEGTILIYAPTADQYIVDKTTEIKTTDFQNIPLRSKKSGSGYVLPIGATLTLQIPIVVGSVTISSLYVFDSVDGQNIENDGQALERLLNAIQNPAAGGREQDYYNWALDANNLLTNPIITNAIILPNFLAKGIVGIFGLAGSGPGDWLLNQGLLASTVFIQYSRTLNNSGIEAIIQNVNAFRPINDIISVATNDTFVLPDYSSTGGYIKIFVSLVPNVSLSTILTIISSDQNNNPINIQISVEDLILRETRRAIVNFQFGGIQSGNTRYIPISAIEQSLDNGLNAISGDEGIYASILLGRQVLIYNPTTSDYEYINIPLPTNLDVNGNIQFTYDINYNNIDIVVN